MQVIVAFPPNFEAIDAVFHLLRNGQKPWFAYGDTIFNPYNHPTPPEIFAHEAVHARQQRDFGGPELWWDRYLIDQQWRLEQEIEAHRAEWRSYVEQGHGRAARRAHLSFMAGRLSGGLYGRLMTRDLAKREISKGTKELTV